MIGILLGAWLFCMVSFCAVGVGCRFACRRRRLAGRGCICGRHPETRRVLERAERSSRLQAAERRVRALQRRYVEGRLSIEQYESELDRVLGPA